MSTLSKELGYPEPRCWPDFPKVCTDQLFLLPFATHHIWPHSKFCPGLSSGLSVTLEQHALFTITTKATPECQEALPLLAPLALGSLTKTRDTSPLFWNISLWQISHSAWRHARWKFLSQWHFIHLSSASVLSPSSRNCNSAWAPTACSVLSLP